jgi:hypothetical protein
MDNDYYIVLHGAKKNVGDFLIRDRAKKLLQHIRKDRELVEFPSWKSLDDKLDVINKSKALIIMGGPGISQNIYPKTFPLASNLDDIKVPIVLLGVGSYVSPLSYINSYKLSIESLKFLNKVSFISVRDIVSKNILENNNLKNITMSGCPAWYDIDKLNTTFNHNIELKTIVLSTPQKKIFFPQFIELLKNIKNNFPKSEIIVTFNRGYTEDKYTNKRESSYMTYYWNEINKIHDNVVDLSSNLELFLEHLKYDLHIGYRLHTHINFISNRKFSYLLSEDSRAYGHCQTLSLPLFNATKESILENILPTLKEGLPKRVINYFLPLVSLNDNVVKNAVDCLKFDTENNFCSFYGLDTKIDNYYKNMEDYIKRLP